MVTKQQILSDFTAAFKERDELKKAVLSDIKAEILVKEKSKAGVEVDGALLVDIIKSMVKKRKEAAELYREGGRPELAEQEEKELAILQQYLPEQLSEEQVREVAQQVIAAGGFGAADFGKAMAAVMLELKGKAEGATVGKVVKELLAK